MQSDCLRPSFLLAIGHKSAHAGGITEMAATIVLVFFAWTFVS